MVERTPTIGPKVCCPVGEPKADTGGVGVARFGGEPKRPGVTAGVVEGRGPPATESGIPWMSGWKSQLHIGSFQRCRIVLGLFSYSSFNWFG